MNPSRESIFDKLKTVVAAETCVRPEEISERTTLGSLGLDSLEMVHAVIAIEDTFDADLIDSGLSRSTTLGELLEWLMASAKP